MFVLKRFRSSFLFLTFLCLTSLSLTGCPHSFNVIGIEDTCTWNDQVYLLGDIFPTDCNQCECTEDGLSCTTAICTPDFCEDLGFEPGDSWPHDDGCNTCSCLKSGQVVCSEMACPPPPVCEWKGEIYQAGESFGACDECYCEENGEIICLGLWCPEPVCEHDGNFYVPGDKWTDSDGCNSCGCGENGQVYCTEMACPPPAVCEWNEQVYKAGETFGECDECQCLEDGQIVCIDIWCPPADLCLELGYEPGEVKQKGCELCTCIEDGMEVCEELGDCNPGCELNGVHYEVGEKFGECDECECHENGMTTCVDTLWCQPKCDPEPELCDGEDNDCDGQVDEGSVCCPDFIVSPQDPCMQCSCTEDGWQCDDSACVSECVHQGEVYFPGEIFGACGECVCTDNGEVICDAVDCPQPLSCQGKDPGTIISQGCLECLCLAEDLFVCFDSCGGGDCQYQGDTYSIGEVFGACDECTCTSNGAVCLPVDCGWQDSDGFKTPSGD